MKQFSAFVALVSPLVLSAQITIGAPDMPSAGDTMRYQNTTLPSFDGADTGPGHAWHFEALLPTGEAADTAVTVGSTPFLYQFYFNNALFYPDWDADYALRGTSIDFQGVQLSDVYDYYKKDATGFRNVGFGANINGVPASVRRIPVDWVHRFPMNYGDMDTSYSEFSLDVPSLFSFTQQQTRYNEVDGWGTLYLPADTFDVLRVKSTLVRFDSVYIEQFGQGFAFPEPETIEYKWIAQGMDEPVLQIVTTGGQITTARFFYEEDISTGVARVPAAAAFNVYPNPASASLRFVLPGMAGTLTLRNMQGLIVATERIATGRTSTTFDASQFAAGAYSATFSSALEVHTTRVVIAR